MDKARRIYIADDEANIRSAIKKFLENAGYLVEDFENGDLLLAAFNEREADLVILDVMMPGSNGFVICKEIRKTSHVPIFMLTARDSDLDYATGLDLGSDDYLSKPFSPMALVMRIKALFRRLDYERDGNGRNGGGRDGGASNGGSGNAGESNGGASNAGESNGGESNGGGRGDSGTMDGNGRNGCGGNAEPRNGGERDGINCIEER